MIKKGLRRHKSIFKSFKRSKVPAKKEDVNESGKCGNFLNFLHFHKKSQMIEKLKKPEIYKPFQIIILLGFVQQFSGITILRSYVVKIFNDIFETDGNEGGCMGWRHFVDNDISWTLFIKMGDFLWTLSKGDISWTLFGDFSWTLLSTRSPLFG